MEPSTKGVCAAGAWPPGRAAEGALMRDSVALDDGERNARNLQAAHLLLDVGVNDGIGVAVGSSGVRSENAPLHSHGIFTLRPYSSQAAPNVVASVRSSAGANRLDAR